MTKYKIRWDDGSEEDELFDTFDAADEMAMYYQSCEQQGTEILNLSNPGDYPYDEDTFEPRDYDIEEIDD